MIKKYRTHSILVVNSNKFQKCFLFFLGPLEIHRISQLLTLQALFIK